MIIEAILAFTFVGALLTFVASDRIADRLAFLWSLAPLVGSLFMWSQFSASGNALLGGSLGFEETYRWFSIAGYTVNWHTGVDGISMPMVVLTTVLTPLAILAARSIIDTRESQFYGLMLLMETSLIGVFTQLNFFPWFVFWEAVLVPAYFLIGIWGGPRRTYAAVKFFVYTNLASLVMFIGFMALVFSLKGVHTFSLPAIAQATRNGQVASVWGVSPSLIQTAAFAAMFFGFAVKLGIFPFHTWLPDAYVEAPAPVTVVVAGVVSKMGAYAFLRFNFTMLPQQVQQYAFVIGLFAVVSVLYGALVALGQQDIKRIVAYSSITSMGFLLLGLVAYTTHGVSGAAFQMVAHGLVSGLMFMTVGVIYTATRTRMVGDMSGLADRMPMTIGIFVAAAFGYMGLPLLAGFAGEFNIFVGAFGSSVLPYAPLFTGIAMFGIVIVAGYFLYALQLTAFGPYELDAESGLGSPTLGETVPLAVLLLIVIGLGVAPWLFWGMIADSVQHIVPATVTVLGGGLP